uniref:Calponin family repeat-containing domain protein n=1 Tax=Setaria digitata TaxID=48799 RepID=A0A915PRC7_9BILA
MADSTTSASLTGDGVLKIAHVEAPVTAENERRTRSGKFTLGQLRQTDGLVPLQSGTNQFDSQKGKTGFGMPRNTALNVQFADNGKKWTIDQLRATDSIIRLQSGTNKCDSQRGMTGFGTPRDVRGKHLKRLWELEFPEESMEEIPAVNRANEAPRNSSKEPPVAPPKPLRTD